MSAFIAYFYNLLGGTFTYSSWAEFGFACIPLFLNGFAVYRFLQMLCYNDEHARKNFAKAFKIYAYVLNFFLILVFIVTLVVSVIGIFNGAVKASLTILGGSFLYTAIGLILNIHYLKVVNTYAEHAGEHSEYEKHWIRNYKN